MMDHMKLLLFLINQMIPKIFMAYRKKIMQSKFSNPIRRVNLFRFVLENLKKKKKIWKSKTLLTMMLIAIQKNLKNLHNSWSQRINLLLSF